MKTTEEKAIKIESTTNLSAINDYLLDGWSVKHMCAFNQSSINYSSMIIILEREINT
jgi:hypothetical protein